MAVGEIMHDIYNRQTGIDSAGMLVHKGAFAFGATPVEVTATPAEINALADVSSRIVTHTASGNITAAAHAGKTNLLGEVGGNALVTLTMPAATGSGNRYRFVVSVLNTSTYVIIVNATPGTDIFRGSVNLLDVDAAAQGAFSSVTGDTITLNGTTTGGAIGDWIEIEDILSGTFAVMGQGIVPAGSDPATPFSATVP